MFGKIINEKLIYAPTTFKTESGKLIVNFNLDLNMLAYYGYKEVIKNIPNYDSQTHYLSVSGVEEVDKCIFINYEIVEYSSFETM